MIIPLGVDGQTTYTVTIVSSPAGIPVNGSTNTFDYPILSNVTLTCNVTSNNGSPFTVTSYQWNTAGCYTHTRVNGGNPSCFPDGQTTQNVSDDDVTAEDAGTITCTATISGSQYTSGPFTLRISGEHLWLVYCIIHATIVLYTICCVSCIFTVGIALINVTDGNQAIVSANAIGDYSYVNSRSDFYIYYNVARFVTGLGANPGDSIGIASSSECYFNGTLMPIVKCSNPTSLPIQPRVQFSKAGVLNVWKCSSFTTDYEGIYTCTLRDSAMMNHTVRFGVYFDIRSELLDNICIPLCKYLLSDYYYNIAVPVIDTPPSSTIELIPGSSLTLSCTSRGSPPDTFTWKKDGVLLPTNITIVDYTSTSAVFRVNYPIANITTSDAGVYTCTITNPIGNDSVTIYVAGKLLRSILMTTNLNVVGTHEIIVYALKFNV